MFEAVLMMLAALQASTTTRAPRDSTVGANPDQMICRPAETRTGSRVAMRRICRTRAQWQSFEQDRQQLRRDLNNQGVCGRGSNCTS